MARQGIAEAMHKTAEAITQCRFEATDPASDEVVLFKILQVLCAHGCQLALSAQTSAETGTHALLHHKTTTIGWHALRAQVLSACVRCPGGDCLTNDNVIDIFHACFRIGHYQTERSKDMSGAHVFAVPSNNRLQIHLASWLSSGAVVLSAELARSRQACRRRPSAGCQLVHRQLSW